MQVPPATKKSQIKESQIKNIINKSADNYVKYSSWISKLNEQIYFLKLYFFIKEKFALFSNDFV